MLKKATDWLPYITVGLCCIVTLLGAYAAADYVSGRSADKRIAAVSCLYDERLASGLRLILQRSGDSTRRRFMAGQITRTQYEAAKRENAAYQKFIADPQCAIRLAEL